MDHISKSVTFNHSLDVPHPDHNPFNLLLSGIGSLGVFYLFPPSLWNTRPESHSLILMVWGIALFIIVGTFLRRYARIQMTSTELINLNTFTHKKKAVYFNEIQSYRIERAHKSQRLHLHLTTRQGVPMNFTLHPELEDAFVAEMDRRRDDGVYREV